MLKLILSLFLTLLMSGHAAAQLDDGLTPLQRFEKGHNIAGAFNAWNPLHCSQQARIQNIPEVLPNETVLKISLKHAPIKAKDQVSQVNKVLQRALDSLSWQGDTAVANKHVCTGFYNETASHLGNALSKVQGYLIFDYKMIQHLYSLPDEKRSLWVYDFLVLHEFAHQLQYWTHDSEVQKTFAGLQSAKRPELAADCVAGALLHLINLNLSDAIYEASFKGAQSAAELLGDFDKKEASHHGTPAERRFASSYGSGVIKSLKDQIKKGTTRVSSWYLLNTCNAFVDQYLDRK